MIFVDTSSQAFTGLTQIHLKTPDVGANGIRPHWIYCPCVSSDLVSIAIFVNLLRSLWCHKTSDRS
ncbi:MAG: hypothetical protein F6K17_31655 [Okeania sp. SIO3C4]|nr:hypothetical protein [Okeania sp. SIO3C4]